MLKSLGLKNPQGRKAQLHQLLHRKLAASMVSGATTAAAATTTAAVTTTTTVAATTTTTDLFQVGERVECFWSRYAEWYAGKVIHLDMSDNSFQVLYDDGETHWHVINQIDVRVEQVF